MNPADAIGFTVSIDEFADNDTFPASWLEAESAGDGWLQALDRLRAQRLEAFSNGLKSLEDLVGNWRARSSAV